jgi:hypothetical protein
MNFIASLNNIEVPDGNSDFKRVFLTIKSLPRAPRNLAMNISVSAAANK